MKTLTSHLIILGWICILPASSAAQNLIDSITVTAQSEASLDVNPVTNMIYASDGARSGGYVTIINGTTRSIVNAVQGSGAHVNPKTNRLYAGILSPSQLAIYDGQTGAAFGSVPLGGCAFETAVDTIDNRVWVGAQCGGDYAYALDGSGTVQTAGGVNIGGVMGYIAVNPVTHYAYVSASGTPKRITPGSWIVSSVPFAGMVYGVNVATNKLYAWNPANANIEVVDGSSEAILGTIAASGLIAVNSVRNRIYVYDYPSTSIVIFDGNTHQRLGVMNPPPNTNGVAIAVNTTTGHVYLLRPGMVYVFRDDFTSAGSGKLNAQREYIADSSTVLLMHMNEASGASVADASMNNLTGTIQQGVTFAPGRFGNATTYVNQGYYSVPHSGALNLNDLTIEMWIYPTMPSFTITGSEYNMALLSKRDANVGQPYTFSIYNGGALNFNSQYQPGVGWRDDITPGGILKLNTWQHVAVTRRFTGGNCVLKIYLNGVLATESIITATSATQNTRPLWIGKDPYYAAYVTQGTYQGRIDELRISNVVRSPLEFNLQLPPVNLSTATLTSSATTLTWQNGGGLVPVMRYKIYRGADSISTEAIDSTASVSYLSAGLTSGSTYYYRVSAVDSSGFEGAKSYALRVIPGGVILPPNAPSGLQAIGENAQVTLTWFPNAEASVTKYRIYMGNVPTSTILRDSTLSRTDTMKVIIGLVNGSTYYFDVTAVDNFGWESSPASTSAIPSSTVPVMTLSRRTIDFGSVEAGAGTKPDTLFITNNGTVNLSITNLEKSGANPSDFTLIGISFPVVIAPSQRRAIPMAFSTPRPGLRSALLTISSNDPANASVIDTLRGRGVDTTPPAAPQNINLTPSTWTSGTSFSVTWTNPSDASGIAKLFYKTGSLPTVGSPGDSVQVTTTIAQITVTSAGSNLVYLYLQDSSGLKNPANAASARVLRDVNPPIVAYDTSTIPVYVMGTTYTQSFPVTVTASDDLSGLKLLSMFVKPSNASWSQAVQYNYSPVPPYTVTIQPSNILANATVGLSYRIVATDSANNVATSPTYSVRIYTTAPSTNPTTIAAASGSNRQLAYRIVSVPLNLSNKTPADLLETQTGLGAYDRFNWRFFRIASDMVSYEEYDAFKGLPVVTPGRAFFFITSTNTQLKAGPGQILRTDDIATNGISLSGGYNLIGNPFGFDVAKDSITINGVPLKKAWAFTGTGSNGGWDTTTTVLKPWSGWLVVVTTQPAIMRFHYADRSHGLVKASASVHDAERTPPDVHSWSLRLRVARQDNGVEDSENLLGVRAYSTDEEDEEDLFEPPMLGDRSVSAFFAGGSMPLTHDYRAENQAGWTWEFRVKTPDQNASLLLNVEGKIPNDRKAFLLDLDTRMATPLADLRRIPIMSMMGERRFRIIVGSTEFVSENSGSIELVPQDFRLLQNYPNPFNPSTLIRFGVPVRSRITLSVFDLLGREIEILFSGEMEAGFRELMWLPNAAAGVYYYQLEARPLEGDMKPFQDVRKAVLLK